MASKADRFYFENFIAAAEESCRAAEYLVECLTNYEPDAIGVMLEKMHAMEHAADKKKHEMSTSLAKAFVTPIDREDLAELSQNIDEVTDGVEEILQRFYVHRIPHVLPHAIEFAKKLAGCCTMMREMLGELENFKKPEKLLKLSVDLNQAEEECDRFYLEAARAVPTQCTDLLEIIAWREIYDYMEDCADACVHVADTVATVVMKNT